MLWSAYIWVPCATAHSLWVGTASQIAAPKKALQNKPTWANQQSSWQYNGSQPTLTPKPSPSCRDQKAQLIGSTAAPLIFTLANQLQARGPSWLSA